MEPQSDLEENYDRLPEKGHSRVMSMSNYTENYSELNGKITDKAKKYRNTVIKQESCGEDKSSDFNVLGSSFNSNLINQRQSPKTKLDAPADLGDVCNVYSSKLL